MSLEMEHRYSRTSLIWTPVIRADPSTGQYADIAEIVGSTVGVA